MKTNATSLDRQALQLLLVGIAALTFALGAQAGEPASADRAIRSVVVDYSDLDLSENERRPGDVCPARQPATSARRAG